MVSARMEYIDVQSISGSFLILMSLYGRCSGLMERTLSNPTKRKEHYNKKNNICKMGKLLCETSSMFVPT
jgi:hypothetical protein